MKRIIGLLFFFALVVPIGASAQDAEPRPVRANVVEVVEERAEPREHRYQVINVETDAGDGYTIDSRDALIGDLRFFVDEGDRIYIEVLEMPDQEPVVYLVDVVRTGSLAWIFVAFVLVTLFVGRARGLASLVGLGLTFAVLFGFILPSIANGQSPVMITVIGSIIILAVNLYLTHGFKSSTTSALLGTSFGLLLVVFLADVFMRFSSLSGLGTDDAAFLQLENLVVGLPEGILLAGIVLGAVGALDDVAVTQAETVFEIKKANKKLGSGELYKRTMNVGRHHIASIVNTLVLAYAGAALPLLLLFTTAGLPVQELINTEAVAEEIVRTLAGTIGLVMTVPLATWFASLKASR